MTMLCTVTAAYEQTTTMGSLALVVRALSQRPGLLLAAVYVGNVKSMVYGTLGSGVCAMLKMAWQYNPVDLGSVGNHWC